MRTISQILREEEKKQESSRTLELDFQGQAEISKKPDRDGTAEHFIVQDGPNRITKIRFISSGTQSVYNFTGKAVLKSGVSTEKKGELLAGLLKLAVEHIEEATEESFEMHLSELKVDDTEDVEGEKMLKESYTKNPGFFHKGGFSDDVWQHPVVAQHKGIEGYLSARSRTDEKDRKLESEFLGYDPAFLAGFLVSHYGTRYAMGHYDQIRIYLSNHVGYSSIQITQAYLKI